MHPDDKRRLAGLAFLATTITGWFLAAFSLIDLRGKGFGVLLRVVAYTPHSPVLLAGLGVGAAVGFALAALIARQEKSDFGGAPYVRHLRGAKMVPVERLARMTRDRKAEQVIVAEVPMPLKAESLHTLVQGSTGTGKSVLLRRFAYSALLRLDRMVVVDPNGDLYSKFGRPGDKLLNPYDARTEEWSFFNEIREDFDFERLALSIVPHIKEAEAEQWRAYGRLLLAETARKAARTGHANLPYVFDLLTGDVEQLRDFLADTKARTLFVDGADRALGGARFVLGDQLAAQLRMPVGGFSLREWLEDEHGGNLFITWREDQVESIRELISCWVDIVCTYSLSLPENEDRPLWVFLDELHTLGKLTSLIAAATKGRKHGIRLVGAVQSTAQLSSVYGVDDGQILRSCFRNLVVLGGSKTDDKTAEDMSKGLGEQEVERYKYSTSGGDKHTNRTKALEVSREPVVMPAQITGLPDLTAFVAFTGELPVARSKLKILRFQELNAPYVERARNA
jgi:Type IV secretion-system coupling protein DNA-binding domain